MKNKCSTTILLLITLIINGCQPSQYINVAKVNATASVPSPSQTLIQHTMVAQNPQITTTVSPLPTITPSITPYPEPMVNHVVTINAGTIPKIPINSMLVLNGHGANNHPYLFDLGKLKLIPLVDETVIASAIAVSPDQKYVLVIQSDSTSNKRNIIIVDSLGKSFFEMPLEETKGVEGWLNEHQILLFEDWEDRPSEFWPPMLISIDIFSGETKEYHPLYPDLYNLEISIGWNIGRVVIDPSSTRLVYPAFGSEQEKIKGIGNQVLWDITNTRELIRLPTYLCCADKAIWSQDGEFVYLIGNVDPRSDRMNDEIIQIDRLGNIKKLTTFGNQPPIEYIRGMAISPDGRMITFTVWDNSPGESDESLAILKIDEGIVDNFFLESNQSLVSRVSSLYWSPDSKYIGINQQIDLNTMRVVIFDPLNNSAFKVIDNLILVGWINSMEN